MGMGRSRGKTATNVVSSSIIAAGTAVMMGRILRKRNVVDAVVAARDLKIRIRDYHLTGIKKTRLLARMRVRKVEVVDSVPNVIPTINTITIKKTNNLGTLMPHVVVEEARDTLVMRVSNRSHLHPVVVPVTLHQLVTSFKNNSPFSITAPHPLKTAQLLLLSLMIVIVMSRLSLNLIRMVNS